MQSQDNVLHELSVQRASNQYYLSTELLQEMKEKSPEALMNLYRTELSNLHKWQHVENLSVHGQALALYHLQKIWDFLDPEYTSQYEYSFVNFSCEVTGKAWSTINNLITMARVWLSDEVQIKGLPPGFNPYLIDPSKLLLAASKARLGELSEGQLQKLADPNTRWSQVRDMINDIEDEEVGDEGERKAKGVRRERRKKEWYFREDNLLYYSMSGTALVVAELNDGQGLPDPEAEMVRRGVEHLLRKLDAGAS